jgi:iron complex transport system ATP-binding protein
MYKVENLVLGYGTHTYVLRKSSFSILPGKNTVIIGPNGSGKSTLLNALARLLIPWEGEIYYQDTSLRSLPTRQFAKKIALLPQTPHVPDDFTVYDLVSQGRFPYRNWLGFLKERDIQIIQQAIDWVGMGRLSYRMVSKLSGGERQRAYLAMALTQEPEVLLLDEPTTFLDICYQLEVMDLIRRLNQEKGITIITVLHNINYAIQYADQVIVLYGQQVHAQGHPEEVITPELCEEVFQVRSRFFKDEQEGRRIFVPVGVISQRGAKSVPGGEDS